ncbi:MAG: phage major capsid protein [Clostridium sp.]
MDLKKLLALINSKVDKKKELVNRSQASNSLEEVRSLAPQIEGLDEEIAELRGLYDAAVAAQGINPGTTGQVGDESWQVGGEQRSQTTQPVGGFNPIASYGTNAPTTRSEDEDMFGTIEYRQAFRNYIVNGTPIPEQFKVEERADALTTVGDVGAIIPTTILNRVIEDLTVEGKILNRVSQTSYQGGISIPISEINPEASWLGVDELPSDEQKAKMEAKLTFSYHVLEAKVAIGLLAATVTLPVFENTVVKQLKKAMIRAIEKSIVSGTGAGKPLGFTKLELPTKQIITMSTSEIGTVRQWAKVEGAIPEAEEDTVIYVMSKNTWENYLNGMTDANGQRIGLGKINEKGQKILNGREVLTTDLLPGFDSAQEGEVFGAVIDLAKYILNSNLSMYYKKYFNEDKNKWINKALMIVDGKYAAGKDSQNKLVGAEGILLLKKGSATPSSLEPEKLSARQIKAFEKAKNEAIDAAVKAALEKAAQEANKELGQSE